jgi:hypothetical protein
VVKLFLGNRAGVLFLIPILVFGYLGVNYSIEYFIQGQTSNLGFWGEVVIGYPKISAFSAAVIIILNALLINHIFNTNEFLERNSYMSSLLYVVLMSFYHSFYCLDGILIAHLGIILMLYQFFKLRQNQDGRIPVFNGAIFAGIAASFHPPLLSVLPVLLFMIWIIRPFIFRETILALIGFGIPVIYATLYLWNSSHGIELEIIEKSTNYNGKQLDFLVMAVLFTLLFILSLVTISGRMQKSTNRLKKLASMLWWLVFIGVIFGMVDLFFFKQIERFSFLMLPLSFFLTFSFSNKTFGGIATFLFYLTFLYSWIKFFI